MPKVSVVIPTYNREKYLPDAVNSVLNQTYKDFEIIIVDDGSRDNTKEVVESFMKKYPHIPIRYFYQENKGPAAARNRGIKEAKGEYIAFLDSDEVWKPDKLKKQVSFLINHPDYSMVYSDVYDFKDGTIIKKSVLVKNDRRYLSGNIFNSLILGCFISLSSVLVRKNVIEDVGLFDEEFIIAEDWDLWLRIAYKYKIGFIDEALTGHRIHTDNLTLDVKREVVFKHLVVEKMFKMGFIANERLRRLAHTNISIFGSSAYLYSGKHKDARKELIKAILYYPFRYKLFILLLKSALPPVFLKRLRKLKYFLLKNLKIAGWTFL